MKHTAVQIEIQFIGPIAQHNLACWLCEGPYKNPAVYDMNPNWCFRPCWDCQARIKAKPWWKRMLGKFSEGKGATDPQGKPRL